MFKHLGAGAVFLVCVISASLGQAHLAVLETDGMQEITGAAGICVPAVENACADKPQTTNALLPDNDRIKEVAASLKDTATPVRPDPNVKLLPETGRSVFGTLSNVEVEAYTPTILTDTPESLRLDTFHPELVEPQPLQPLLQPLYIEASPSPPVSGPTYTGSGGW